MRRLTGGMPCMLLAMLVLFARLVAPVVAMPSGDPLAGMVICHSGVADEKAPAQVPEHGSCLLCPACHLVGQAVLPPPEAPMVRPSGLVVVALAAPLPPAIGPPARVWVTAQPTGPPLFSV